MLTRSPILRRPGGRPMTDRTRGLGPPRVPGFVPVLVCVASLSVAFGAVSVTVPAFASQHAGSGGQSLAGVLLAVWGLGSGIGGFGYGALRIAAPLSRQFGWLLAAVAVSLALLAVMPGPLALGAALAIGGPPRGPAVITSESAADPGTTTSFPGAPELTHPGTPPVTDTPQQRALA